MKEKNFRIRYNFFSFSKNILNEYKNTVIILILLFIFCFTIGIFNCADYSSFINVKNLIDKNLYSFLDLKINFFSYFLIISFWYVCFCLFIIIFTRNRFFVFLDVVLFALISYIFGFDLYIIIVKLGLAGIILGVLFRGILGILVIIVIAFILSISFKRLKYVRCNYLIDKSYYKKIYLLFICFGIIILFLSSLLFSVIHIFVIID